MKIKLFILGLGFGVSILSGCNDELSQVGSTIQPDSDVPELFKDSFQIQATTIKMDSVYARTIYGSLGEIYDPIYGNLKSDYICQFYCPENFRFRKVPANGKIDSVKFEIAYPNSSWIGDSLTPMHAQIYQVTKPLQRDFYTDINPEDYCNMQKVLGTKTYTAFDKSVPDSVRYYRNGAGQYTYYPTVVMDFPTELGQRLYDETVNNPETFKNQNSFNQFFPGVYVTTTYGTGNILNIGATSMYIYYRYKGKGSAGQDSLINTGETFTVTNEVIQLNRFKNTDLSHLLQPNDEMSYLKSPAGVCTRFVIPAADIAKVNVDGRIINNMPFSLKAYPQEDWKYALAAPSYLLLLPEDSVKTFFPKNKMYDLQTSFYATYSAATRTYSFGNISNVLQDHIKNTKDQNKDLVLVALPVEITFQEQNSGWGQTTKVPTAISNYLKPAGVKLRKDKEAMQVTVTTTKYKDKTK